MTAGSTRLQPTGAERPVGHHPVLRWVLPAVILLVPLFVYALHLDAYLFGTGEDGPVEWATVLAYLAAVPLALLVARRSFRDGLRFAGVAYAVLALGFFFVAGEEVSWGQRILGFGGPEVLVENNLQGEANLHNLLGRYALHGAYIVVGAWGCGLGRLVAPLLPWLRPVHLYVPGRELLWWFSPVVAYYVFIDYVGPTLALVLPALEPWADGPPRYQEVVELTLAGGFLLFVLSVWQRREGEVRQGTA